jgi:hypothetical protein
MYFGGFREKWSVHRQKVALSHQDKSRRASSISRKSYPRNTMGRIVVEVTGKDRRKLSDILVTIIMVIITTITTTTIRAVIVRTCISMTHPIRMATETNTVTNVAARLVSERVVITDLPKENPRMIHVADPNLNSNMTSTYEQVRSPGVKVVYVASALACGVLV